jgi:hypothetical protein
MRAQVEEIQKIIQNRDEAALRAKFKELVPEYHVPDNSSSLAGHPADPKPKTSRRAD